MPTMSYDALLARVHDLSDLELAVLLCLVAKEHCLIRGDDALLNDIGQELSLVRVWHYFVRSIFSSFIHR